MKAIKKSTTGEAKVVKDDKEKVKEKPKEQPKNNVKIYNLILKNKKQNKLKPFYFERMQLPFMKIC